MDVCDKRELEILVISCDKFDDCWIPFSECIQKFWPDCPYPISLCTETKDAPYDISLFTKTYKSDNKSWSARISDACNKINAEYVLFVLEDQWLAKQIDMIKITQIVREMQRDESIGVVYLEKRSIGNRGCQNFNNTLMEIPFGIEYRMSAGPAIWRKDYLKKILKRNESAWEFERVGSFREETAEKKVLYPLTDVYTRIAPPGAISRGKWETMVPKWAEKEEINVNFRKRPIKNFFDNFKYNIKRVIFNCSPAMIVKIQNHLYR